MPGQTQLIIITTDEDIIRQFSLNRSTNTQLIDLDKNSEQIISKTTTTDDIINLPFLAELSKLNSSNDQIYKRALDSTDTVSPKPAKTSRRSIDMICTICGDKAIGHNYDALSCASCKAFFRRNAKKNLESLMCFSGEGQCSFAHDVHRKCPKCRLERCFAVGMKKEYIMGGEEKPRKKKNPEQNPNMRSNENECSPESDELDRLFNDISEYSNNINLNLLDNTLFDTVSVEDGITIENIQSAFLSAFENDVTQNVSYDYDDSTSALISLSSSVNESVLNVIKFFRQINHFEELDVADRLNLIKYNVFPLYTILKCFYFIRAHGCSAIKTDDEIIKLHRFYALCFGSDHARETYVNVVFLLVQTIQQDETILSLLLVVLMFSQGLSMKEDEPLLKNVLQVNRAQSHYVQLLWNYMIHKWGDIEAHKRFIQLLSIIFQMQKTSKMVYDYCYAQIVASNAMDQIAPLMQTILHIS